MSKAKLIVISAPSGSGKTTIVWELLRRHPEIEFSVSVTTRPRRPEERNGKDYFFLTREDFHQKIQHDELVEWEQIYDDYYATLRSEVERALRSGKSMLFDVDVKGAISIKKKYPQESVLIFIKPPNTDVLRERLTQRKTESEGTLQKRFERVPMELAQEHHFDFAVVNEDISLVVEEIEKFLERK